MRVGWSGVEKFPENLFTLSRDHRRECHHDIDGGPQVFAFNSGNLLDVLQTARKLISPGL